MSPFLSKVLLSRPTPPLFLPRWVLPKFVVIWVLPLPLLLDSTTSDGLSTTVPLSTLLCQPWLPLSVKQNPMLLFPPLLPALSVDNQSQLSSLLTLFHSPISRFLLRPLSLLTRLRLTTLSVLPPTPVRLPLSRLVPLLVSSDSPVPLPSLVKSFFMSSMVLIRPFSLLVLLP